MARSTKSSIDTEGDRIEQSLYREKETVMKLLTALMLCAAVALVPACGHAPSEPDLVVGNGTVLRRPGRVQLLVPAHRLRPPLRDPRPAIRFPAGRSAGSLHPLRERNDLASVCMRGSMAEVISIARL